MMESWKFTGMEHGTGSAVMAGMSKMQELFADSLAIYPLLLKVYTITPIKYVRLSDLRIYSL